MFTTAQYELLDFGTGRKLERFGTRVLDRPAPAAERVRPRRPARWTAADGRFQRQSAQTGRWQPASLAEQSWSIVHAPFVLELKCGRSGAVGVFPEQAENWDWLARRIRQASQPPAVLNLFAYTGGSTLAAAAAGAHVTHVDSARTVVGWARRNARASGLHDAPIRWIVEDALRFVRREVKRGRRYAGIILDPPSYGHGPRGQPWKIERDLPDLLTTCRQLLAEPPLFMLLTCHAPALGPAELEALLGDRVFGHCQSGVRGKRLFLRTADGHRLASGQAARWPTAREPVPPRATAPS